MLRHDGDNGKQRDESAIVFPLSSEQPDENMQAEPQAPAAEPQATAAGQNTEEEDYEDEEEAIVPKYSRKPDAPTKLEREQHMITHLPFRTWCRICIRGRGKNLPHYGIERDEAGVPMIAIDFFFLGDPDTAGTTPAVAIRDLLTKAIFAHVIPGR